MERLIYLDNSATTKPCKEAVAAAVNAMEKSYGNPSSLYEFGMIAEDEVTRAREILAKALFCRDDEIYFTSCGSESNNTAILGAAKLLCRSGKHIVTTTIEHPSVLEPINALEKEGYEVTRIAPNSSGLILESDIKNAIRKDTVLVSVMYVNNEVGSILPVEKIKNFCKEKGSPALVHIDCVQAFGKIKINANSIGADLISLSAHKIHGIKGAGALFVKKGVHRVQLVIYAKPHVGQGGAKLRHFVYRPGKQPNHGGIQPLSFKVGYVDIDGNRITADHPADKVLVIFFTLPVFYIDKVKSHLISPPKSHHS